jgi:ribulose-phosphate 3-epimerase
MALQPLIAPSILSADFSQLGDQVALAENGGADWLHLDVMDGHFVPQISFGIPIVETCKRISRLPLNVHLMIEKPERHLQPFATAGADHLIVHIETCLQIQDTLQQIHDLGCQAGVALNPGTAFERVEPYLEEVDLVLVMSVDPGYSGQPFITDVLPKVSRLRERIDQLERDIRLEIDGGIDNHTLPQTLKAGADTFVAGSAIFKHKEGIVSGIASLRREAFREFKN